MPTYNGFGFDNDKNIAPSRPKPPKQNPKQPIPDSQPRARVLSVKHTHLLTQSKNFKTEIAARTEKGTEK
jgi:hypothetical protein